MKNLKNKLAHIIESRNYLKHCVNGEVRIEDLFKVNRTWDLNNFDFTVFLNKYKTNLQRGYVWTNKQQSEFINSVIYNKPLGTITIIDRAVNNETILYEVLDGKQRLTTLMLFKFNHISINIPELDLIDIYFKDFPIEIQSLILSTIIKFNIYYENYNKLYTDDDKLTLFKLLNFKGIQQDQEHLDKFKI